MTEQDSQWATAMETIRLFKAIEPRTRRQQTVTNIAYKCDFSSSRYFATCYKKLFGFSPIETPRI